MCMILWSKYMSTEFSYYLVSFMLLPLYSKRKSTNWRSWGRDANDDMQAVVLKLLARRRHQMILISVKVVKDKHRVYPCSSTDHNSTVLYIPAIWELPHVSYTHGQPFSCNQIWHYFLWRFRLPWAAVCWGLYVMLKAADNLGQRYSFGWQVHIWIDLEEITCWILILAVCICCK